MSSPGLPVNVSLPAPPSIKTRAIVNDPPVNTVLLSAKAEPTIPKSEAKSEPLSADTVNSPVPLSVSSSWTAEDPVNHLAVSESLAAEIKSSTSWIVSTSSKSTSIMEPSERIMRISLAVSNKATPVNRFPSPLPISPNTLTANDPFLAPMAMSALPPAESSITIEIPASSREAVRRSSAPSILSNISCKVSVSSTSTSTSSLLLNVIVKSTPSAATMPPLANEDKFTSLSSSIDV